MKLGFMLALILAAMLAVVVSRAQVEAAKVKVAEAQQELLIANIRASAAEAIQASKEEQNARLERVLASRSQWAREFNQKQDDLHDRISQMADGCILSNDAGRMLDQIYENARSYN